MKRKSVAMLVLFSFVMGMAPMAYAGGGTDPNTTASAPADNGNLNVTVDAPVSVVVKPTPVTVENKFAPTVHVAPTSVVNNVAPAPVKVVIEKGDEWYRQWWVWTLIGVGIAGGTAGIVCGTGHCGGGDTTTVNLGGAAVPTR